MLPPCKLLPFTTRGRKGMLNPRITSCGPTRGAWETNSTHLSDSAIQLYACIYCKNRSMDATETTFKLSSFHLRPLVLCPLRHNQEGST